MAWGQDGILYRHVHAYKLIFVCSFVCVCNIAVNKINQSFMFLMAEERIKKLPVLTKCIPHQSNSWRYIAYVHVHIM